MTYLLAVAGTVAFMRWGHQRLLASRRVPEMAKTVLRVALGGGGPGALEK